MYLSDLLLGQKCFNLYKVHFGPTRVKEHMTINNTSSIGLDNLYFIAAITI